MFCQQCGSYIETDSVFCPVCGEKQLRQPAPGLLSEVKKGIQEMIRRPAKLLLAIILMVVWLILFLLAGLEKEIPGLSAGFDLGITLTFAHQPEWIFSAGACFLAIGVLLAALSRNSKAQGMAAMAAMLLLSGTVFACVFGGATALAAPPSAEEICGRYAVTYTGRANSKIIPPQYRTLSHTSTLIIAKKGDSLTANFVEEKGATLTGNKFSYDAASGKGRHYYVVSKAGSSIGWDVYLTFEKPANGNVQVSGYTVLSGSSSVEYHSSIMYKWSVTGYMTEAAPPVAAPKKPDTGKKSSSMQKTSANPGMKVPEAGSANIAKALGQDVLQKLYGDAGQALERLTEALRRLQELFRSGGDPGDAAEQPVSDEEYDHQNLPDSTAGVVGAAAATAMGGAALGAVGAAGTGAGAAASSGLGGGGHIDAGRSPEAAAEEQAALKKADREAAEKREKFMNKLRKRYGIYGDDEKLRKVMEKEMGINLKEAERQAKIGDRYDTAAHVAEGVQLVADIGVDVLAKATGQEGIRQGYIATKNIAGRVTDAALNDKSITGAIAAGALDTLADLTTDQLEAAGWQITGNAATSGFKKIVDNAYNGKEWNEGLGTSLAGGAAGGMISKGADALSNSIDSAISERVHYDMMNMRIAWTKNYSEKGMKALEKMRINSIIESAKGKTIFDRISTGTTDFLKWGTGKIVDGVESCINEPEK